MTDDQRLALAIRLAREAAGVILAARKAGVTVAAKGDLTPVTEADHAAERLIVCAIRAEDPGVTVIAEEEVAAGQVGPLGDAWWLIDPLDGTRGFVEGRDEFAVCLGFVRAGRPVLGAIALPASNEVFWGMVGHGAWKEDPRGRRPIAARVPPPEGLTVFASRHHANDPRLARFVAGLPVARLVNAASALKFCRVAEGEADLYPRFGRTMEWDTAGAQAIVEAAGGSVTTLAGLPLTYGKRDFVNPDFVCRGRP